MFLLPPVALFGFAFLLPGLISEAAFPLLILLAAAGLAAVATSEWPLPLRIGVGALYALSSLAVLPFLGLLAVCTTGDCI